MFKLFASCDPIYLREHAPALMASAAEANNNLHIHIINGEGEEVRFMDSLRQKWEKLTNAKLSYTWGKQFALGINAGENRTIFACDRFVTVTDIITKDNLIDKNNTNSYLIIDVDCLIMKHIEEPKADIGLFFREPLPGTVGWEQDGTRIAAGAVYYGPSSYYFALQVDERIRKGPYVWFLDQIALNEAYDVNKDGYTFEKFTPEFMDWEFIDGTTIWTGKGPRKYNNPKYVAMKQHYHGKMINA